MLLERAMAAAVRQRAFSTSSFLSEIARPVEDDRDRRRASVARQAIDDESLTVASDVILAFVVVCRTERNLGDHPRRTRSDRAAICSIATDVMRSPGAT